MKFSRIILLAAVLLPSAIFAGGGGQQNARAVTAAPGPLGKYASPLEFSTARTMNSTIVFDEKNPEKRSFNENRWTKTFLDQLNIRLTHKWIATDTDSNMARWNAAIASGDIPDMAQVSQNEYKLLYEAGYIADMSAVFNEYASPELKALIPPNFLQEMTLDGKLLGYPLPNAGYHGATVLFIRQDWLDALNLPVPRTIEDVMAVARAFARARPGGNDTIGIMFSNNNNGGLSNAYSDGKWDGFVNGFGAYMNYWLERDGKLVFSEIQPEMRQALLAMQELYKDGTMNRDFAVTNNQLAMEYVAGGKVGIVYSTAWNTNSTIMSLHNNDPRANVINVFPPSVQGKSFPIQVNSPAANRVFVSSKTRNPEAAVKMANLAFKLQGENFGYYMEDTADGFRYFKYLPWNDYLRPVVQDISVGDAIRTAETSGGGRLAPAALQNFPGIQELYNGYTQAKAGNRDSWYLLKIFGPGGSLTTLFDAYQKNMLLVNAFNGLPTATMSLKGDLINGQLKTAMFEVVGGADISTWDRAVQRWLADGGQQITDEVNRWYSSVKGR